MEIKFNSRDPVYVQVVQHFKRQIAMGFLEPGQSIPSRRELAQKLKINPNTVQRAYKEMEEEGLIRTESNQPSQVTVDRDVIRTVRAEWIEEAVAQFVAAMRAIHVPVEEALKFVKSEYEQSAAPKQAEDAAVPGKENSHD